MSYQLSPCAVVGGTLIVGGTVVVARAWRDRRLCVFMYRAETFWCVRTSMPAQERTKPGIPLSAGFATVRRG